VAGPSGSARAPSRARAPRARRAAAAASCEARGRLGATKGQIRIQFLAEAILLALLVGAVGVAAAILATTIYAHTKHWTVVVPATAWAGGLASTILIGAIAGLVPALRAARLSPTEALRTL
jgi:putative ABC transport system permease protein